MRSVGTGDQLWYCCNPLIGNHLAKRSRRFDERARLKSNECIVMLVVYVFHEIRFNELPLFLKYELDC